MPEIVQNGKRLCPRSKGCPTKELALQHGKLSGIVGTHKLANGGYHPGKNEEDFRKAYFKGIRAMRKAKIPTTVEVAEVDKVSKKLKKIKKETKDKLIDNTMESKN